MRLPRSIREPLGEVQKCGPMCRGPKRKLLNLASLLFVAVEQASFDNGSMDLSYLYTLLPDPPAEMLSRELQRTAVRQAPRIADQDWTNSLLTYLQQMDTFGRRRQEQLQLAKKRIRRGGNGRQGPPNPKPQKPKP